MSPRTSRGKGQESISLEQSPQLDIVKYFVAVPVDPRLGRHIIGEDILFNSSTAII